MKVNTMGKTEPLNDREIEKTMERNEMMMAKLIKDMERALFARNRLKHCLGKRYFNQWVQQSLTPTGPNDEIDELDQEFYNWLTKERPKKTSKPKKASERKNRKFFNSPQTPSSIVLPSNTLTTMKLKDQHPIQISPASSNGHLVSSTSKASEQNESAHYHQDNVPKRKNLPSSPQPMKQRTLAQSTSDSYLKAQSIFHPSLSRERLLSDESKASRRNEPLIVQSRVSREHILREEKTKEQDSSRAYLHDSGYIPWEGKVERDSGNTSPFKNFNPEELEESPMPKDLMSPEASTTSQIPIIPETVSSIPMQQEEQAPINILHTSIDDSSAKYPQVSSIFESQEQVFNNGEKISEQDVSPPELSHSIEQVLSSETSPGQVNSTSTSLQMAFPGETEKPLEKVLNEDRNFSQGQDNLNPILQETLIPFEEKNYERMERDSTDPSLQVLSPDKTEHSSENLLNDDKSPIQDNPSESLQIQSPEEEIKSSEKVLNDDKNSAQDNLTMSPSLQEPQIVQSKHSSESASGERMKTDSSSDPLLQESFPDEEVRQFPENGLNEDKYDLDKLSHKDQSKHYSHIQELGDETISPIQNASSGLSLDEAKQPNDEINDGMMPLQETPRTSIQDPSTAQSKTSDKTIPYEISKQDNKSLDSFQVASEEPIMHNQETLPSILVEQDDQSKSIEKAQSDDLLSYSDLSSSVSSLLELEPPTSESRHSDSIPWKEEEDFQRVKKFDSEDLEVSLSDLVNSIIQKEMEKLRPCEEDFQRVKNFDAEDLEESPSALVNSSIQSQMIKLRDELDHLAAGDDDSVTMKSTSSVDRVASVIVKFAIDKTLNILKQRCEEGVEAVDVILQQISTLTPEEDSKIALGSDTSTLNKADILRMSEEGGSTSAPPPTSDAPPVTRPASRSIELVDSKTVELIAPRQVSDSVFEFKVPSTDFIAKHAVPVESGVSTLGNLHIHKENASSNIQTLDATITPSLTELEKKTDIDSGKSKDPAPEANNKTEQVSSKPTGEGVTTETLHRHHHHGRMSQEIRNDVMEQLASLRREVEALKNEIREARQRRNTLENSTPANTPQP